MRYLQFGSFDARSVKYIWCITSSVLKCTNDKLLCKNCLVYIRENSVWFCKMQMQDELACSCVSVSVNMQLNVDNMLEQLI